MDPVDKCYSFILQFSSVHIEVFVDLEGYTKQENLQSIIENKKE